jgi:exonuclease III
MAAKRALTDTLPSSKKLKQATIKMTSWNVSSLSACLKKGFTKIISNISTDILIIQETKMNQSNKDFDKLLISVNKTEFPHQFWNHSKKKKGYSGTAVFSKIKPLNVIYGVGIFR